MYYIIFNTFYFILTSIKYHSRENLLQPWVEMDNESEHNILYEVLTSISSLMDEQESIWRLLDNRKEAGVEIIANSAVIDAVLEDACNWVG